MGAFRVYICMYNHNATMASMQRTLFRQSNSLIRTNKRGKKTLMRLAHCCSLAFPYFIFINDYYGCGFFVVASILRFSHTLVSMNCHENFEHKYNSNKTVKKYTIKIGIMRSLNKRINIDTATISGKADIVFEFGYFYNIWDVLIFISTIMSQKRWRAII